MNSGSKASKNRHAFDYWYDQSSLLGVCFGVLIAGNLGLDLEALLQIFALGNVADIMQL